MRDCQYKDSGGLASRRCCYAAAHGLALLVSAWAWPIHTARANDRLRNIPPNTALDLGPSQCEAFPELVAAELADSCATITDYSGMTYDPIGHRMLVWGGGHAATYRDDVEALDLETLEWYVDAPPTPCSNMVIENVDLSLSRWITTNHPIARHSYDLLVVVPSQLSLWMLARMQGRGRGCNHLPPPSDEAPYVLNDGHHRGPARYDFVTRQWTFYQNIPTWDFGTGAEYDPVSGKIVLVDGRGMDVLDPVADQVVAEVSWPDESLAAEINSGEGVKLVYVAPRDSFYVVIAAPPNQTNGGVYEIQVNRSNWSQSSIRRIGTPLPSPAPDKQAWAYEESVGLIVGGVRDGVVYAFDPETEQWSWRQAQVDSSDGAAIGSVTGQALAYDPVDAVIIFRTDYASGWRTWAYRWGDAPSDFPDAGPGIPDAAPWDSHYETAWDASPPPDARVDSGRPVPESVDAGTTPQASASHGCSCRTSANEAQSIWKILLFSLLAVAVLRRK